VQLTDVWYLLRMAYYDGWVGALAIFHGYANMSSQLAFGLQLHSEMTLKSLGPLLYIQYTAELSQIVALHGLNLHMYADDCQIYTSTLHLCRGSSISKPVANLV